MSRFRPHCLLASITARLNFSTTETFGTTTDRAVTSGTNRVTPSSVSFSIRIVRSIALGQRRCDDEREGEFAIDDSCRTNVERDGLLPDGDDLGRVLVAVAVEEDHAIASSETTDGGEVVGLGPGQVVLAGAE